MLYSFWYYIRWCTLSAVGRRGRSAGQIRAKISKNRCAARRKNLFLRAFSDFSKNFYALKTPVFACFRLFCEPLRARAISLYLKKRLEKFFLQTCWHTVYTVLYCVHSQGTALRRTPWQGRRPPYRTRGAPRIAWSPDGVRREVWKVHSDFPTCTAFPR